ncbi:MAG TPA: SDR family oxidoreductase [Rhizomicrobium sp.]|nr:SDR family oxidoreductase [Rhizomicrobium sp.]
MERGELTGKVAIVTGAATGIGSATAIALARHGAQVVVNYSKSSAEAAKTADTILQNGGKALVVQGDVASDADCRRIAEEALKMWGRIDILVNNAGTTKFAAHENLEALTAQDFAGIYAVNVIGPFQMIRAAAPAMKKSGHGAVVNVSSVAGISGVGSSVAYAASKGALNTMTLSLAKALAPEIRVNAVCPGYVATRWFSDRFGQERTDQISQDQAEATPLKRAGAPEDIADAIVFFCLPMSRHITGDLMSVDAGMHLSLARRR